jgi:hypothetical protein
MKELKFIEFSVCTGTLFRRHNNPVTEAPACLTDEKTQF